MDNEYLKWLRDEYKPICGGADTPVETPAAEPPATEPPATEAPAAEPPPAEPPVESTEQLRTRAEQAEQRAADAERRAAEIARAKQTMSPADYRKWVEDNISVDPLGVTSKIADDHAWRVANLIRGKEMVIEEYIDKHPQFKDREREIKRKLSNFYPPTQKELEDRIDLECHAAVGRDANKKIDAARKQGQEEAEKKKKVLGGGTAVGSTPGRSVETVTLNSEETDMAQRMGLSVDKVKEAQKKGNVVE